MTKTDRKERWRQERVDDVQAIFAYFKGTFGGEYALLVAMLGMVKFHLTTVVAHHPNRRGEIRAILSAARPDIFCSPEAVDTYIERALKAGFVSRRCELASYPERELIALTKRGKDAVECLQVAPA